MRRTPAGKAIVFGGRPLEGCWPAPLLGWSAGDLFACGTVGASDTVRRLCTVPRDGGPAH